MTINVLEECILVRVFEQIKYQMQHQINDINESSVHERVYFFDEGQSHVDGNSLSDSQMNTSEKNEEMSSGTPNSLDESSDDEGEANFEDRQGKACL